MERKIEIPDTREEDEAAMENGEPATATLSSSDASEEWEKISEDWVSLFLDPAILDNHSTSLPSELEGYPLPETEDHEPLLLHSTDDRLMALGSSVNMVEEFFGGEEPSREVELVHAKAEPGSASPVSSLTQEVEPWKGPEELTLKREANAEVSNNSSERRGAVSSSGSGEGALSLKAEKKRGEPEVQSQDVLEDQQSDHSDGERKGEGEDDEKRRARLMRNRESAQLSRQRKKVYVDELEGKLRTMAATVAELNTTITHLTAENVNLRRQLGYYFPAPGVCPRPGMPMHVLPMGPYPGRPVFPGGQMPPVPIPRMKTQAPARSAKRPKTKEGGGDKKRAKVRAAGAASMAVMGLLCVAMLFGSTDTGVDNSTHVRVGGRVLTSFNEDGNAPELGAWRPLEPGEYGPEREGVPSAHTRFENEKLQGVGFESLDGNRTLTSSTYLSSVNTLMGSDVVPSNASQSFAASVFVPSANGLVKVDGNLIIQAVMAGDKAAMKDSQKKQAQKKSSSGSEKTDEVKQTFELQPLKSLSVKVLDNLPSKVVKNATTGPFVTARPVHSVMEANNPVLRAGALQQWMLGGLHGPVLNTGMCTELFQFDTGVSAAPGPGSSPEAKTMAESVAAKAAQGSAHNVTSTLSAGPRSRRDPFAVPLPPVKPKPSGDKPGDGRNGTDHTVREQNLRHGVPSMVVSVMAGPEEYGDGRRKGAQGLSRIFVVVLVDNQKYVTYSCMLPSGGPQAHVVAE